MVLTQRQLEHLHRAGDGALVLPFGARLSPLAQDWVRHQKVSITYDAIPAEQVRKAVAAVTSLPKVTAAAAGKPFFWWSDGPDGVAKAALGNASREVALKPLAILADSSRCVAAVKQLALEIHANHAAGGVLVVKHAGEACVLANQCPLLRAAVATSLSCVDEAIARAAANVLILQHGQVPLGTLAPLITRFVKTQRQPDAALDRDLAELRAIGAAAASAKGGCKCG